MVILNFSTYKPRSGGLSKSAHDLIKILIENEVKVSLLVPKRFKADFEKYNVQILHGNPFVGFLAIIYDPIVNFKLYLKKRKTLIIYDGFWPLISFGKYVVTVHDLYFLKEKYSLRHAKNSIWLFYWKKIFKKAIEGAQLIRSISFTTTQRIELQVSSSLKIYTVYHYLNTIKPKISISEPACYAIHVGNLIPRKNIVFLIERFSEMKEESLVMIGNDMLGIESKKNMNITLKGYVNNQQKESLLKKACLLVTTSHEEGFCYPVYEALEIGIPVVAPDIDIFKEFLPLKYLYKKENKESFSEIYRYIKNNREQVYKDQVNSFNEAIQKDQIKTFTKILKSYEN